MSQWREICVVTTTYKVVNKLKHVTFFREQPGTEDGFQAENGLIFSADDDAALDILEMGYSAQRVNEAIAELSDQRDSRGFSKQAIIEFLLENTVPDHQTENEAHGDDAPAENDNTELNPNGASEAANEKSQLPIDTGQTPNNEQKNEPDTSTHCLSVMHSSKISRIKDLNSISMYFFLKR